MQKCAKGAMKHGWWYMHILDVLSSMCRGQVQGQEQTKYMDMPRSSEIDKVRSNVILHFNALLRGPFPNMSVFLFLCMYRQSPIFSLVTKKYFS